MNEKHFLKRLLGFTSYWFYKPTETIYVDKAGVYTSEKIFNLSTINEINLKSDVTNGSVVNGIREPTLFNWNSDKPCCYKVLCEPDTILHKKIKKNLFWIQKHFI